MSTELNINIVYAPGKPEQKMVYRNEYGKIWNSNSYDPTKKNIGMGWYSIRKPRPGDSILVVEPKCVLEKDYNINFVQNFKYIFTWASQAFTHSKVKKKVVPIPHPTYHTVPSIVVTDTWLPWDQRENKIIFIANNKSSRHYSELYSFRILLADILHKRSSFEVEWYGQIRLRRPYYKGQIKNKQELLRKSKFSVCTENCYDPIYSHGYFSEKMPDVWQSGAVPLYIGCHNIDSLNVPDTTYIDLRKYCVKDGGNWNINKDKLLKHIENLSETQYTKYTEDLKEKILKTSKMYELTAYEQTYKTILETFHKRG